MQCGFIKLHRQILDWEWYDDPNTMRLFLHILLIVNHKEKKWRGITIKKGQKLTSQIKLADETGLTRQQVRTSLKKLIATNEITMVTNAQHTVITVNNWNSHQDQPTKQPTSNQRVTNEQPTDNQRVTTNKNDKNVNNVNNKDICQQVANEYNNILPELGKVKVLSDKRKAWIKASIKQMKATDHDFSEIDTLSKFFNYVSKSEFLTGQKSEWSANFDFLIQKNNLLKVVEGSYE